MIKMSTVNSMSGMTKNTNGSMYSMKKTNSMYAVNKSASSHQMIQKGNACWPPHQQSIRKSFSTNSVIETKRGFKPSDVRDPNKREFLTNLTQKIWKLGPVR